MRLDYKEIETVRTVVEKIVGKGSKVRVFGSRLNDSKRGGDLDLLVESDDPVDAIHRADLKLDLEEKLDLPLDIIFLEKGKKRTAFQELAYSRSQRGQELILDISERVKSQFCVL
jgi:predicted nucleotidyltransferase